MTKYICNRCMTEYSQQSKYQNHINRKRPCKKLIKYTDNNTLNNTNHHMNKEIQELIKRNNIIVEDINQLLHNEGIEFNRRLKIVINLINYKFNNKKITDDLSDTLKDSLIKILNEIYIEKNELFQKVFMFYCDKSSKINLDQYYSPMTIGAFITSIILPNKLIIDPACGTGDLIINYNGKITLWDISKDVINVCQENYTLNNKEYNINCINSINEYDKNNNYYDYGALNPPFGSSTVITDKKILDNYELGKGKKKEEIGIIFIERLMKNLSDNSIGFIILPNGYLGNNTTNAKQLRDYLLSYRIIAILELPSNTFSRSGTGVSTSLLIIQKTKMPAPYNILIKKVNNIGYILNKKNTPYKYKTVNGKYILKNNKPVLDNDFDECCLELKTFANNENIQNIINSDEKKKYEIVNTKDLESNILDVSRYLSEYKSIIVNHCENNRKSISNYIKNNVISKFDIINDKEYIYLDIKQITSPMYNKSNLLYGHELPGRAKIQLQKYDIIVSKLKGKITFTIILDDVDNIICTNGFVLLRPENYKNTIILFANLFTNNFKIQHNSLCTGSIMASISDHDIKQIYIDENINFEKYENIMKALIVINTEV